MSDYVGHRPQLHQRKITAAYDLGEAVRELDEQFHDLRDQLDKLRTDTSPERWRALVVPCIESMHSSLTRITESGDVLLFPGASEQ